MARLNSPFTASLLLFIVTRLELSHGRSAAFDQRGKWDQFTFAGKINCLECNFFMYGQGNACDQPRNMTDCEVCVKQIVWAYQRPYRASINGKWKQQKKAGRSLNSIPTFKRPFSSPNTAWKKAQSQIFPVGWAAMCYWAMRRSSSSVSVMTRTFAMLRHRIANKLQNTVWLLWLPQSCWQCLFSSLYLPPFLPALNFWQ